MQVSFGQWMAVSVPFGVVCVLVSWLFLLVVVRPDDIQSIPVVFYERGGALGKRNIAVIVLTLSVIALFVGFSFIADVFGDIGIISLCFVTIMFGSGLLSEVIHIPKAFSHCHRSVD